MIQRSINPGHISVRLGNLMAMEEAAMARGDLHTASNLQGMEADYLSVHMTPTEWRTFEAMPGLVYDCGDAETCRDECPTHMTAAEGAQALGARRRFILQVARRANVFTRPPDQEIGDSDTLDEEVVA